MGIHKDVVRGKVFFEIVIVKNYKHRVAESHFFLESKAKLQKAEPSDWREREKEIDLLLITLSDVIQPSLTRNLL